jgi:1-acyl-sn-glycerol-3-phosphate acyltransferase
MADRPSFAGRLRYDFAYWWLYSFYRLGFSYRRTGRVNMPAAGPVLVVANHQSMFDPTMIGVASRRYLTFLARSTLFEQWPLGPMLTSLNAIPIDRGFGKDGIQSVLKRLGEGQAVLMFPEGERTHSGEVQSLKPGVSLLIKRVKCPIVPVGVAGAFAAWNRFMKRPRLSPPFLPPGPSTMAVSIGKPIDPARYARMGRDELLEDLRREIAEQHAAAERLRRK